MQIAAKSQPRSSLNHIKNTQTLFWVKRRSFIKQNHKKQTIERDFSFKAALLLKRFQFVFAKFE
jgi:hypothetical protein